MEDKPVKLKEKVYYARIHHNTVTYDVCDLVVQSIRDTYFLLQPIREISTVIFFLIMTSINLFSLTEKMR